MSAGTALVMTNRQCRLGNSDIGAVLDVLRGEGLRVIEHYPESAEALRALIHRHRFDVDRVIIGGGDGTLNAAVDALRETAVPLAILPLGTANDLARTLGLPTDPVTAARVAVTGRLQPVDLGRVNGHCYFNAAHIGLGVAVTRRLTREAKGKWGVFSYARGLWDAARASRPFSAEVRWNGQCEVLHTIQIGVGNGRFYGGGMVISEDATIDDGELDIYSLEAQSLLRLASLVPALRAGGHGRRTGVWLRRGSEIQIRTKRPRSVVADGELVTRTPARFDVLPAALRVFVPAKEEQRAA